MDNVIPLFNDRRRPAAAAPAEPSMGREEVLNMLLGRRHLQPVETASVKPGAKVRWTEGATSASPSIEGAPLGAIHLTKKRTRWHAYAMKPGPGNYRDRWRSGPDGHMPAHYQHLGVDFPDLESGKKWVEDNAHTIPLPSHADADMWH